MSKFIGTTKPLKDAVETCIPTSNINKFDSISQFLQLSITPDCIIVTHNASAIKSEVRIRGSADGGSAIIIDASLFKQLLSTLTSQQMTLEIVDSTLYVTAGKNKFTIPSIADISYSSLNSPKSIESLGTDAISIDSAFWKRVKDNQLYAVDTDIRKPLHYISTDVDGTVLSCGEATGVYTMSTGESLGKRCLLSDAVLNVLESTSADSKIVSSGESFIIYSSKDAYDYCIEFTPLYEDASANFEYPASSLKEIFDSLSTLPVYNINTTDLANSLKQVKLFLTKDKALRCQLSPNQFTIKSDSVECPISVESSATESYAITLFYDTLKSAISTSDDKLKLIPLPSEEAVGTAEALAIKSEHTITILTAMVEG